MYEYQTSTTKLNILSDLFIISLFKIHIQGTIVIIFFINYLF